MKNKFLTLLSKYLFFKKKVKKSILKQVARYLLALFLLVSCNKKTKPEEYTNFSIANDTITLPENLIIKNRLKKITVKEELYRPQLVSVGIVKAIPNYYAEIAPPYSGRVTKVHLRLGMKVNPGTPLFEMMSPDFTEIQKNYLTSKTDLKKTELNLKRQKDLNNHGVGSFKDLEEAEAEYEIRLQEYEKNRSALKIFNSNPETLILGQPLIITSPIKGKVIDNEIVNGHYIKADDVAHVKIAQLNKVWIMGQVKEKDINFIHKLDGTEINIAAYPNKIITGKVYYIDEIIDEDTRSVRVVIECENKDLILKPGMYVTVNFVNHPKKVLFVPTKSIFQMNDNSFVFVQTKPNTYVKRKVKTGISENERIIITEGLEIGETVINEGGFYLLNTK